MTTPLGLNFEDLHAIRVSEHLFHVEERYIAMHEGCCHRPVISAVLKALGTLSPVDMARLSQSREEYTESSSALLSCRRQRSES